MYHYLIALFFLCLTGLNAKAQDNLLEKKVDAQYENIKVEKLSDSDEASSFIIWVKDTVRKHYHEFHTENLYVLEGKAKFYLADKVYTINAGDYFQIPKKSVHSVKVISKNPLKVLSVQSPKFDGSDRVFVD